jgi:hypothetical protein
MLLIVPACYLILEDFIANASDMAAELRERPTLIPAPIHDLARDAAE